MSHRRFVLLLALALGFQQLPLVAPAGLDLPLIVVALAGCRVPLGRAVGWGAAAGLLQDLLSAGWAGPSLAGKAAAGALASLSQRSLYRERVTTQTLLVAACMGLQQAVAWMLLAWDGTAPPPGPAAALWAQSTAATTLAGAAAGAVVVRLGRRGRDPATA